MGSLERERLYQGVMPAGLVCACSRRFLCHDNGKQSNAGDIARMQGNLESHHGPG